MWTAVCTACNSSLVVAEPSKTKSLIREHFRGSIFKEIDSDFLISISIQSNVVDLRYF